MARCPGPWFPYPVNGDGEPARRGAAKSAMDVVYTVASTVIVCMLVLQGLGWLVVFQYSNRGKAYNPEPAPPLHPSPAPSGLEGGRPGGEEPFLMAADALRAWSLSTTDYEHVTAGLSPCGRTEAEQRWFSSGERRDWESGVDTPAWTVVSQHVSLFDTAMSFEERHLVLAAAEVVAQIRHLTTCQTYQSREGTPRLTGEILLPALPAVEATYGFCERIDWGRNDTDPRACTAYLAREEIVTSVRVRTSVATDAERLLRQILPVAAEALAKA